MKTCHIALLPLANNNFNKYKSDLKFIEAACCEVAAIASPIVYSNTIKNNINGILCNDPTMLPGLLNSWSKNIESPKKIAREARIWCKHHRMQYQQTNDRFQWYLSLWERREELNNALLERIPELKD